jgi:hypothetical protein
MAKKIDGIIEAARYAPDGKLQTIRLYERRGTTYSDRVLLPREEVVQRLKKGLYLVTGRRVEFHASTFETGKPVTLQQGDGQNWITTGTAQVHEDHLEGVRVF